VVAGSSHCARIIDQIGRDGLAISDATVPGFRLTPDSAKEMAEEVKHLMEDLNPENTAVLIQVIQESGQLHVLLWHRVRGDVTAQKRG
jgi:hypothetical protein